MLTPKQAAFVAEYLIDLNAAAAARRAGYSAHRADAMGHENLRKPEIAAAIAAAQQKRAERVEITQDMVLGDILRIGIAAEQKEEFAPALKARELLGRHLGMFKDKVEMSGTLNTMPDEALDARIAALAKKVSSAGNAG